MREILITGSSGFIGTHLVEKLGNRCDLHDRERYPFSDCKRLAAMVGGKKAIIHLAGLTRGEDQVMYTANVEATRGLLDTVASLKTKKPLFVLASTFAVYATQNEILHEGTATRPKSIYGKTKLEAEEIVKHYSSKYHFPALILRIANVYGPGMLPFKHSVIATWMECISKGKEISINGNGEQERDFVYIKDLVGAFLKALRWEGNPGEPVVINICSGVGISMNQLTKLIGEIVGDEPKIVYPHLEALEEGYWVGDNSEAKQMLGWLPNTSLVKGLEQTYETSKKN